jgi:hypothetical protein
LAVCLLSPYTCLTRDSIDERKQVRIATGRAPPRHRRRSMSPALLFHDGIGGLSLPQQTRTNPLHARAGREPPAVGHARSWKYRRPSLHCCCPHHKNDRPGTARGWGLTALPFSLSESINTNKQNVVDSTITALMYQKVSEKTSADLFAAVVWVVRDRNFQVDRTKN